VNDQLETFVEGVLKKYTPDEIADLLLNVEPMTVDSGHRFNIRYEVNSDVGSTTQEATRADQSSDV